MRAPLPQGSRRVESLDGPDEAPMSAASRAHRREMNMAACAAIRRVMDEQTGQPDVELIDGGLGPPSAIIPVAEFAFATDEIEYDVKKWDRQMRDGHGRFARSWRK
jgi:hypothetical protein